jgi:hypothetical protein
MQPAHRDSYLEVTSDMTWRNNLIQIDHTYRQPGGTDALYCFGLNFDRMVLEHNTCSMSYTATNDAALRLGTWSSWDPDRTDAGSYLYAVTNASILSNVFAHGLYGIVSGVSASDMGDLVSGVTYWPKATVKGNAFLNTAALSQATINAAYSAGFQANNLFTNIGASYPSETTHFTSPSTGDYSIATGSSLENIGHDGSDPGVDMAVLNWETATSENGGTNLYHKFQFKGGVRGRTTSGGLLKFSIPPAAATPNAPATCTAVTDTDMAFVGTVSETVNASGFAGEITFSGKSAATQYYTRVTCDGKYRTVAWRTR